MVAVEVYFVVGALSFTNCAWTSTSVDTSGGAIDLTSLSVTSSTSLTVAGCTFTRCTSTGSGGAVYVASVNQVSVTKSNFTDCHATAPLFDGGALYELYISTSAYLSDCTATECSTEKRGGGIYPSNFNVSSVADHHFNFTDMLLVSTTFSDCSAVQGGGVLYLMDPSEPFHICDCLWLGCRQTNSTSPAIGGGAICLDVSETVSNTVLFFYCYFDGNNAATERGKDIYVWSGTFYWSITSPFDMPTCSSQSGANRTFPLALFGYPNCTWLRAGPQVPTLRLTSGAKDQTVVLGTAVQPIEFSASGGATRVLVTGLPSGVTATKSGPKGLTMTLRGVPTLAGSYSYKVAATNGADLATISGNITVVPHSLARYSFFIL
jgi:hypothetical protein